MTEDEERYKFGSWVHYERESPLEAEDEDMKNDFEATEDYERLTAR